jgi:hypothetical protein
LDGGIQNVLVLGRGKVGPSLGSAGGSLAQDDKHFLGAAYLRAAAFLWQLRFGKTCCLTTTCCLIKTCVV